MAGQQDDRALQNTRCRRKLQAGSFGAESQAVVTLPSCIVFLTLCRVSVPLDRLAIGVPFLAVRLPYMNTALL